MVAKNTRQMLLRIRKDWDDEIRDLARQGSIRYKRKMTAQDLYRTAIQMSIDELRSKCKLPTTYDVRTCKPVATT